MDAGTRDELVRSLGEILGSASVAHRMRVAVDGPPGAGKTTLADELAAALRAQHRDVIRATVDDFLFPRAQRYRRGEYSGEGCYFDAHDYVALNRVLLDPLGPGGNGRFRHAVYDHATDTVLSPPTTAAPTNAVLIYDGVFLLRPELIDRWDVRIFVSAAFETIVDRALTRESRLPEAAVRRRWRERYIPAQQVYFDAVDPIDRADIIVHNDVLDRPRWELRPR